MIEIKNRFTGETIRTVDSNTLRSADLRVAVLRSADLSGADLSRADLSHAVLSHADLSRADLSRADLSHADLRSADLRAADLSGAVLSHADLRSADLRAAVLSHADLSHADLGNQWIVQGPISSQGYAFFLQRLTGDTEPMVKAGCFLGTVAQAHTRWSAPDYHRGEAVGRELVEIVNSMVRIAETRGLS